MDANKPMISCLGLYKTSGGPVKTIGKFASALDADIFSFVDGELERKLGLGLEGINRIKISRIPILRQYSYASRAERAALELKAANAPLISCHSFYRYHIQWVHKMWAKHRTPYWIVPHGVFDPWVMQQTRFLKKAFLSMVGKRFLEDAQAVIFSTKTERDKAETQFNLPQSHLVYWPVETVELQDSESIRQRIRHRLDIPENAKVLVFFGRIHAMKRPLETIRAIARAGCENLYLVMVGNEDGISEADCMQEAAKCGIAGKVKFTGPLYGNLKYEYLIASDAYISLSYRENFNHTAAEALSCGLPVILSKGNDLLSDLQQVGCSIPVDSDCDSSIDKAIEAFVELPLEDLTGMGLEGFKWVEDNLSFQQFQESLRKLCMKYSRSA